MKILKYKIIFFLCAILIVGLGAFKLGEYNKSLFYHADSVRVYNNNLTKLHGTIQYLNTINAITPIKEPIKTTLLSQLNSVNFSTEVFVFTAENQKISKETDEALNYYQSTLQQIIEETDLFLSTDGIEFSTFESLFFFKNQFLEMNYFNEHDMKMSNLTKIKT